MSDSPFRRWVQRGGRLARITLPFGDIMEIALALLGLSPTDLAKLGWTFDDRKRLIDHLLASGKQTQRMDPRLWTMRYWRSGCPCTTFIAFSASHSGNCRKARPGRLSSSDWIGFWRMP
ncbi:hypothetical protein BUMB_01851c [Candidatus Paraburkholderia calva]|nr:hypothetical protein BUMB_01851c [Candidatus Paraburkholderia calva]